MTREREEELRKGLGCLIPREGVEMPSCHEKSLCDCAVLEIFSELDYQRELNHRQYEQYRRDREDKDNAQRDKHKYREALEKVLPIVETAFWDNHTAGTLPGAGYNHQVYRKVSDVFGWRDSDVFMNWKKNLGI